MDMTGRSVRGVFARAGMAGILVLLLTAGSSVVLAADKAVQIAGFAFSPSTVTVAVGDAVSWTNTDAANHTATADGGSFDTGAIGNGASTSVTFSTAGTFRYHCKIHPSMTATVVVRAAGAVPPPSTDTVSRTSRTARSDVTLLLVGATLIGFFVAIRRFGLRRRT
jgi:plastocyanin